MDTLSHPASSGASRPPVSPTQPVTYPPQRGYAPPPASDPPPLISVGPDDADDALSGALPIALAEPTLPMAPPSAPPRYTPPEEARRRNPLWQAIKWPLRKLLLGAYLAGEAIRRHAREALAVGALLLALIVTGAVIVAVTRPAPLVSVAQAAPPALPTSVLHYLHARQRFDAAELWRAYDAAGHSALNTTEPQLQTALNQDKKAGLTFTRYVYTGGYRAPDGTSHYTIEAYTSEKGHSSVSTWYFVVGRDGLIQRQVDLTSH